MFNSTKETTEKVTKIVKIKNHIKNHKRDYTIAAASAAATVVITSVAVALTGGDTTNEAPIIQQMLNFGSQKAVVINLIERSTPSKPVHLVGTNLYFDSLSEAARQTGHHLSMLSKHVNGQIPDLDGDVFELLTPA